MVGRSRTGSFDWNETFRAEEGGREGGRDPLFRSSPRSFGCACHDERCLREEEMVVEFNAVQMLLVF